MNAQEADRTHAAYQHARRMGYQVKLSLIADHPHDPYTTFVYDPEHDAWYDVDNRAEHTRLCPTHSP